MSRRQTVIAIVSLSALATPAAIGLCTRVRHVVETPFAAESSAGSFAAMEGAYADDPSAPHRRIARFALHQADPTIVARHDEVHVFAATYATAPRLIEAQLTIAGTGCVYRTPPGERLDDNEYVRFVREPSCDHLQGNPTGEIDLAVTFEGTGRVAAWGKVLSEPVSDPSVIYIGPPGPHAPALRGFYADPAGGAGMRRIDLLAYLWQIRPTPAWIWLALSFAFALACTGACLFPLDAVADPRAIRRPAIAASCLAAALAIVYVVLIPPFQSPDEPDHLLSFAQAQKRPNLSEEAAAWARVMHFDRIHADARERFRIADIDRPAERPWNEFIFAEDVVARSATTARWWAAIARIAGVRRAPVTLLAVRGADALLFAAAIGAGTALVTAAAPAGSYPQLVCFTFFFVPTLAFFAMQMSEFAMVTSASVLLACGLLIELMGAPRGRGNGLLLGTAGAILFASGRATLPMAPVLAAPLVARLVLAGSSGAAVARRDTIRYWAGAAVFAPVLLVCTSVRYRDQIVTLATERAPASLQRFLPHVWLPVVIATVLLAAAAAAIEIAIRARPRRPAGGARAPAFAIRFICWGAAAAVAIALASSAFSILPHAASAETGRPPVSGVYVTSVLHTMATTFRLRDPDFYLSSSFWFGFGWLETIFADRDVIALTTACAGAAIVMLVALGREANGARLAWLVCFVAGWVVSLYAFAASAYSLHRTLHGRYLIPLYLSMLPILWSAPVLVPAGPRSGRWRVAALLAACAAIHASVVPVLLERYFGR